MADEMKWERIKKKEARKALAKGALKLERGCCLIYCDENGQWFRNRVMVPGEVWTATSLPEILGFVAIALPKNQVLSECTVSKLCCKMQEP